MADDGGIHVGPCSIHLTVIWVLSYGGFIVIANKGMAFHLVQLITVSLPSVCQFTFSFGSMLRNEDHNQLEISNLLHWTRCKKEKVGGFISSVTVEGDLTHMQLFLCPTTTRFPTISFSNHAFIKTETF